MAYIGYGQNTVGGKQLAETMAKLQAAGDELRNLSAWVLNIRNGGDGAALNSNTDFSVTGNAANGAAFSDTLVQIKDDYVTFMATNREKIERLARGS